MKIAYIAHPVSGDVEGNIKKIIEIVRKINIEEPEVVPFVPYLADLYALNDDIPQERERGIKNDTHLLLSGVVDELRLYGNKISNGMKAEIDIANNLKIPVVAVSDEILNIMQDRLYYVVSLRHTKQHEAYITLWCPNDQGYTWIKSSAGIYQLIKEGYHNSENSIPIKVKDAEDLFVERSIDDPYYSEKQYVIPNNKETWAKLNVKMTKNGLQRL